MTELSVPGVGGRSAMRFNGGVAPGLIGWAGIWPPPERMWGIRGKTTGYTRYGTQEEFAAFVTQMGGHGRAAEHFVFERYVRGAATNINLDSVSGVAIRGVDYHPEG